MPFSPPNRALLVALLAAAACSPAPVDAPAEAAPTFTCAADNGGIALPDGFCAVVFAEDLGRSRQAVVASNGDVYVTGQASRRRDEAGEIVVDSPGGVVALRDADGDGVAEIRAVVNETAGTGIDLHDGYLYYSSTTEIWRVARAAGELVPSGEPERIVHGFPQQGQHASKPFTFDDAGNLYVTVGAPSNACQQETRKAGSPGIDPCPQLDAQAGIWRYAAGTPDQEHGVDGARYATGIRNAMGLDWNHDVDALFAMQHGRDSLFDLWGDMFTLEQSAEIPAEEFFRADEGADLGWPYCYFDPESGQKVLAPEYGGDGVAIGRCADIAPTLMAFPAHWAPNDLLFYSAGSFPERYDGGAFIAFHGSWNRMPFPQQGYNVVFVPFAEGVAAGEFEVFASGFSGIDDVMTPGDAEYRPTGLAQAPDGSLLVVDDRGGRLWRIRASFN
jgi:glucose/arabinose dehydrogenase